MFCVVPCADVGVIKKLCKECGGEFHPECLLNMVLIVDEVPAGVSQMKQEKDSVTLVFAGVKPEIRGKGYGDVVIRSAMNKVMDNVKTLTVCSTHKYFEKFGFVRKGDVMVAETKDIVFPSYCHCKH